MKSIATARNCTAFAIVAAALSACTHSPAPAAESASSPLSTTTVSTPPSQPSSAASPDAPKSSASAAPAPQPGELALPPPSASAWNNAQSDGRRTSTDRGITDYKQIIASNRDKFRACYETSLGAHPGIRGQAVLKFTLAPDGSVPDAMLDRSASQILDQDFEACMVKTVKSLSFPPSKRGMVSNVNYPFTFTPGARSANSSH
jgi:TonB family protein